MKRMLLAVCLAVGVFGTPAPAAETESTPAVNAENSDYAAGRQAVARKDWKAAVASFRRVVAAEPNNADGYNMLGFSLRWEARMDEAFAAYDRALSINPNHPGALEYSGVAFVKAGQTDKAKERLARLEKVVGRNAEEYRDLAQAIANSTAGRR